MKRGSTLLVVTGIAFNSQVLPFTVCVYDFQCICIISLCKFHYVACLDNHVRHVFVPYWWLKANLSCLKFQQYMFILFWFENGAAYHTIHYNDVIMGAVASQITRQFIRGQIKKTSKFRVTGLCAGNSPGTGEFPAQMASDAENVPFDDVIMLEINVRLRCNNFGLHPWNR